MRFLEKSLLFLLIPALIFLHILFLSKGIFTPLYGDVMLLVGAFFWIQHGKLVQMLRKWRMPEFWKVVFLIYGMVLFEEIFAALFNHLSEGFSLDIFFMRVLQFWAFNLIAFSGFALGWALITRRYMFSVREIFWISGFLGLFNEGIYKILFANPFAFVIFALPTVFIYGIIATPAAYAQKDSGKRRLRPIRKYLLTVGCIVLLSLPCTMVLQKLRIAYPAAFPPCAFISC